MINTTARIVLSLGSRHRDVLALQQLLSQNQSPIPLTGRFDYETEIAVKSFQSRMFLKPDGVVGPLTWKALYANAPIGMPTLRQGCHGSAVTAIQDLLSIDLYYRGAIDGDFGPQTRLAVERFQADHGLPVDGTINGKTWQAISQI